MTAPRIEFRDVCKRYPGAAALTIKNANISVAPGEFCVFVGPSGCGKSTALRMIAGLEDVTEGTLLINGSVVNRTPPAQRGVAMVFQSYALYPHMSVYENMAFGLRVFGSNRDSIDKKVRAAAQTLQLTELLDRLPKALSGGQRQRVAIGRAIVKEPQVFLFDEPLSNLDAALRVQTRLEIARLHREIGSASMVYVTHDQVEAMTLADKIVLLNTGDAIARDGSVAQVGAPMTLYHQPDNLFVAQFIGSPKMNVLPARIDQATDSTLQVRIGDTALGASVKGGSIRSGEAVSYGIRPEHIVLRPASEAGTNRVLGTVQHAERLGEATLIYFDLGHGLPLVTVRVSGDTPVTRGELYQLLLNPLLVHVFDQSGRALSRATVSAA